MIDINNIDEIQAAIEAMLFASGDSVSIDSLVEMLGLSKNDLKTILNNMAVNYINSKRGIMIKELGDSYTLCTKPEYNDYIQNLMAPPQKQALSQAALETMSIIAYNQPITRARIEDIRGVNSDSSVNRLLERGLIEEAGTLEVIGRPRLFRTTELFLKAFNFKSLDDLPELTMDEKDRETLAQLDMLRQVEDEQNVTIAQDDPQDDQSELVEQVEQQVAATIEF